MVMAPFCHAVYERVRCKARILNYSNSFYSGDYSAVVGYGSVGVKC